MTALSTSKPLHCSRCSTSRSTVQHVDPRLYTSCMDHRLKPVGQRLSLCVARGSSVFQAGSSKLRSADAARPRAITPTGRRRPPLNALIHDRLDTFWLLNDAEQHQRTQPSSECVRGKRRSSHLSARNRYNCLRISGFEVRVPGDPPPTQFARHSPRCDFLPRLRLPLTGCVVLKLMGM